MENKRCVSVKNAEFLYKKMTKMTKEKKEKKEREKMIKEFLEKIVINVGVGRLSKESNFAEKILPSIQRQLALISGQFPQVRPLKRSIAGFKARQGQIVGLRVTLRRKKMVDFFERLIRIVMPRVRDFRGISLKSIDKGGVLNIGLKEQFVFPEINPEEADIVFSLGINIVPKSSDRERAIERYIKLGVPLKK